MRNTIFRAAILIHLLLFISRLHAQVGKVGINTTTPQAMLHVKDSSVLFSGVTGSVPASPGNPPASGEGVRMMWYPAKAAFRAGRVTDAYWDKDSIGPYSTALGYDTRASGNYSTACGSFTNASGSNSTSLGNNTNASNYNSTSLGSFTTASGVSSTSMGSGTTASGNYSTSMGFYTHSKAYASLSIGRYNDSINASSRTSWVSTDPLFIIGNGIDDANRSNAMTVLKNAKTGINMSDPVALLDLKGFDGTINRHIRLEDNNTESSANIYYTADLNFQNNEPGGDFYFKNDAGTNILSLFSSGNMTILGTLTQNSDSRLKKNIQPLQNSLQKILSLSGYHYIWKENYRDKDLQTGLLAQQVEQQMPELVTTDEKGIKSVNYNGVIPYTIEAIKELKKENEQLKSEISQLKILYGKLLKGHN